MSTTQSQPIIPPRPSRDKSNALDVKPVIPPRPRRIERSVSPQRESFARSPLNDLPSANHGKLDKSMLYNSESANTSSTELPHRPSSVALPSIGQEGSEYAEVFGDSQQEDELGSSPTQTRNIANNLKLHAPKPSLPVSSAKRRVSTVTRTDSGQAAAFGIGKPGSIHDDHDPAERSLNKRASFASHTSNGTERPPSSLEGEHGIPHIGQYVPMYPNAGDVQAPSPAPTQQPFAPGIGFHNDGSQPRHHGRKTSARGNEIPFDAYGKHGHGQVPHDRLEKAYYQKHPELLKKETGAYHGPFAEGRAEWAMSSEDLNKIVRDTASRGTGLGTSPGVIGTPSEQIGFQATEEYTSRISSPRPQPSTFPLSHSNASDSHVDSPLKHETHPTESMGKAEFEGNLAKGLQAPSESALESEVEDEDTIHVDHPGRRSRGLYAGSKYFESTDSLGVVGEDVEEGNHDDYSAPILASDEVAKEPFGYELEPAVSPLYERGQSSHGEGNYHVKSGSASSLDRSRPSSRPGSIHGNVPGFSISNSTPLEDLEEYEPLFPEDGQATGVSRPLTAADKVKRPELKNRKFPSADVWEDSPNSLHYTATVSTPQRPEDVDDESSPDRERADETPAQAFARKQEELAEKESKDSESFLNREQKPWAHKSHLTTETRPNIKQRFPSRDIWEDTPDSLQLETTVGGPQSEENVSSPVASRSTGGESPDTTSPVTKPAIPARPVRVKPSGSPDTTQPTVPGRPSQRDASPPVPVKAKPAIPARPSKPIKRESYDNNPLTTVPSNSSAKSMGSDQGSVAAAKPKPPVPSRPVGGKIAALQGGFMSDLNKRLQLGPQAPKKEETPSEEPEVEQEKAPLVDVRKGRARGPARRAPAKSPAPPAAVEKSKIWGLSTPSTWFEIDPEGDSISVPSHASKSTPAPALEKESEPEAPVPAAQPSKDTAPELSEAISEKEEKASDATSSTSTHGDEATSLKQINAPSIIGGFPESPEEREEDALASSTATLKAEPETAVE